MSNPYVGEIRMFGGSFAPAGWMFCSGQLLPISENETLFQLIGTTYGGDGQSTFALPDLRGRIPIHSGQGAGLGNYTLAQTGGTESETITTQKMPVHTHPFMASSNSATSPNPGGNVPAEAVTTTPFFNDQPSVAMNAQSILPQGGSQPHENMAPYLCVSFIISLFGVFPTPT